jgi:hypothetical protein
MIFEICTKKSRKPADTLNQTLLMGPLRGRTGFEPIHQGIAGFDIDPGLLVIDSHEWLLFTLNLLVIMTTKSRGWRQPLKALSQGDTNVIPFGTLRRNVA